MFEPSITIVGPPKGLETPRRPKQPGTAVEYEYRSAEYEYEYEYDKQPTAAKLPSSSYSVRLADGTRTRTRNRCSSDGSIIFRASFTIVGPPKGLETPRRPKQPGTAIEYEYRSAEYEYEYDKQPTAAKLRSSSYSVRLADGTRTRNRTRCSSDPSTMFNSSFTIDGSPERLETSRKQEQLGTAVEYEYRSAEYEYEYDEQPTAAQLRSSSYSVRLADGTRTRNRNRCSELFLMMFAFRITISDPPVSRLTCLQNSSLLSSSYPPNNTTKDQYNTIARPGPPWQSWIFSGANKK